MEGIALAHGEAGEGGEVPVADGGFHGEHARRHDRGGPCGEQAGRRYRRLHPRRAADAFLGRARDQDQRVHLGPVRSRGDFARGAVESIILRAGVPRHVSAEEAAAGGSGSLPRDEGELLRGLREFVEIGDGAHESGEAGGGGSEACGCGEIVGGDQAERVGGERGEAGVGGFEGTAVGAEGREAGEGARGFEGLGPAVEEQGVGVGELSGARSGGVRAKIGLREGHGEGGIGGEVERGVTFSPVPEMGFLVNVGKSQDLRGGARYLMTAMFTGAVVLAR